MNNKEINIELKRLEREVDLDFHAACRVKIQLEHEKEVVNKTTKVLEEKTRAVYNTKCALIEFKIKHDLYD